MTSWQIRPAEPQQAGALAAAAGLHPLTAQLLLHRGMSTPAQAFQFLHPSVRALESPRALPDLPEAVERLRRAIAAREPILIFSDSDVDGMTASVILYEALRGEGAAVRAVQSNRIADGYGMPESLVRELCGSSTKILILVDCGTNQADAVRRLGEQGIETIIVDHHVPLEGWARPAALINPHRDQAFRSAQGLCSAGLALKLAQGLFGDGAEERLAPYLDLAALGTLADCAPLLGDNRAIVVSGLARLLHSDRHGLRRLCEATDTREPVPEQILRRLVPRLNASGRLGRCEAVWHLLQRGAPEGMDAWMDAAETAHDTTKQLHRQTMAQAEEQISRMHFRGQYVMLVSRPGWHQGLMGPLASQLAERYGRPAIAIAMQERHGVGSGRSIPMFNLLEALTVCQDLLVRFGGHAQACGLTIDRANLEPLRTLLNERAAESLRRPGVATVRLIDLELPLDAIEPRWVEELEGFAPFGQGNPRPTVLVRDVTIDAVSPRIGVMRDGVRSVRVKGSLPQDGAGARYDVVLTPTVADGELILTLTDAKGSEALSAQGRI